ncbi:MAG: GDP-mannose 4,6-dehydratase [Acidobacteriota bacterium]
MRWLITGADGFVAGHLLPHLLEQETNAQVFGMVWRQAAQDRWPEDHPRLQVLPGELGDSQSIGEVVNQARPEIILHLAAASSVAQSWRDPEPAYQANILGQLHLLEAARTMKTMPTVVIASSAEIYGRDGHDGKPISEEAPLRPLSPYAVTKAVQDLQGGQYHAAHGLPTVRLRLFNHTGPGRPPHFVASSFAKQIAEIEQGHCDPVIHVGNLDVARDFTDVRDIARAWRLAALHGRPGEAYNVCSGRPTPIRRILDILLEKTDAKVTIQTDATLLRAGEIDSLYGDRSLFSETTGWQPEIPLEQTLTDLLQWWREAVGTGSF